MGTAWQYQPTNDRYKSGTRLIELLIEARSKGGSLLLNIGPKPNGAIADEQENRLREMAAWYFVNREAVDDTRAWVINKENNTWYTTSPGKKAVYAIVTDAASWAEGDRKEIVLHAAKATASTKISVLGQNSIIQEYKPGKDVSCRFVQTDSGLVVSVVKAQRLYDDHKWPNPVVIKLEDVLPAIQPIQVLTVTAKPAQDKEAVLTGSIANYKGAEKITASFYYRIYNGQTEDLYGGNWTTIAAPVIGTDGSFKATVTGLIKGQRYEYKAVVLYNSIPIDGDKKVWQQ
jgi:alpha-L-fucosidase